MSSKRNPGHLAVESVRGLAPYVPGKPAAELERELGLSDVAKLASNENPYGPSPRSLAAMQAALAGLKCGVGPSIGRAHVNNSVRKSVGQHCAQSQAESSRIAAGVGGEQWLEHGVVGCEIDEERPARLPI